MRKFLKNLVLVFVFFISFSMPVYADPTDINLTIRDEANIIFSGIVPLPTLGTVTLNDNSGTPHIIDARSVLAIVDGVDQADSNWNISNLTFFNSFGSFYIKCINYSGGDKCDNWQYVVNNSTPFSSVDQNILTGGETVYLYFGNPHQVILSSNTLQVNQSLTGTSESYNYTNNTWSPLTGVTLGITQPNPNDPFSPIEIFTQSVNSSGQANFSIPNPGSYSIGIKEDFYFPSYTIIVSPMPTGGAGLVYKDENPILPPSFSVPKATEYLKSTQRSDGSFEELELYTDWGAIAYGADNVLDNSRDNMLAYLHSHTTLSSLLTDNERRAMTLLALGQNPYSFNDINYIDAIINSFDGTQFGDLNLTNDDIFALIPLASSGYTTSDEIIVKDVIFILSKQKSDGSWEDSVDLTAAAIQALKPFESLVGSSDALQKASNYLSNKQNNDGGWNSVSSTSWAMQAMNALGTSWMKNGKNGIDYLGTIQATDGAVSPLSETLQNRIWATSYAIPAALGKPWDVILHKVQKPTPTVENSTSASGENISNNINSGSEEKEKIVLNQKPILVEKIEDPQIVPDNVRESSNPLVASVPENQESKSFAKILFLPALLLLIFLLGRVWIRLQVRL